MIAAAWVPDYAPPLRGLILATPAFRVKLYVPFAVPFLRLRQSVLGPGYVKSFIKASMLTRDPAQAKLYNADRLIFRQIAVNVVQDEIFRPGEAQVDHLDPFVGDRVLPIPSIEATPKGWARKSGARCHLPALRPGFTNR